MLQIAIVDDEENEIDKIYQITSNFFKDKEIEHSIATFTSGEELLDKKADYDLIFLDVQMEGIDGIETAKQIRRNNKKVQFIYITNYTESMKMSFAVHPFAFLEKPIDNEGLCNNLSDYISYYNEIYKKNEVSFKSRNGTVIVNMQDILYFEYIDNRQINVVLKKSAYSIIDSMNNLQKQFAEHDFLSPHKSFLINMAMIQSFYSSLIMVNGVEIPIARNKRKQINKQLFT